eukprot:239957_1
MQSLYMICGMLFILNNTEIAFLFCMILSIIMLLWHLLYPIVSKKIMINNDNEQIYNFSSINYFTYIQITCYVIITYISIILYLYIKEIIIIHNNLGNIILY